MSTIVVDASVVAKLLFAEEDSDAAACALGGGSVLSAPDLIFAELANVVCRKAVRGEVAPGGLAEIASLLAALPIETVPLRELAGDAVAMAVEFGHPAYDCFYVAAALRRDAGLVTADRRMHELAVAAGMAERAVLLPAR